VQYRRHTAPGEGLCETSDKDSVGMSVYWKEDEAMLVFANLTDKTRKVNYRFTPDDDTRIAGSVSVEPMKMKTIVTKLKK